MFFFCINISRQINFNFKGKTINVVFSYMVFWYCVPFSHLLVNPDDTFVRQHNPKYRAPSRAESAFMTFCVTSFKCIWLVTGPDQNRFVCSNTYYRPVGTFSKCIENVSAFTRFKIVFESLEYWVTWCTGERPRFY